MPDYVLQLTKKGEPVAARLLVSVGTHSDWIALVSPSWFPSKSGRWATGRNATKFRQWSFVRLLNGSDDAVATLPNFPYAIGSKFTIGLIDPDASFFAKDAGQAEVEVISGPPDHKTFKLREVAGGALSFLVIQGEAVTFEITDPSTQETATYIYKGFGISFGLPIPKLPKTLPGASGAGPWNDFDAPGWWTVRDFEGDARLQAPYNVGMGTAYSYNVFQFVGHVNNNPGYQCEVNPLSTGRTIALPSAGFTTGSMELWAPSAPHPRSLRKGEI